MPVGDAPPFRQEIVGGVRRELPPPPGSVPPREVIVPVQKGKDEGEDVMRLRLGMLSEPKFVAVGPLVIKPKGAAGENDKPWARLTMPERPAAMAVVFRDPREKSWDSVLSITMGDDLAAFPLGAVRFANATPFTVNFLFQGRKSELKPGKVLVVRGNNGGILNGEQLAVVVLDGRGQSKRIFDSAISQGRGERTNAIIHWSDGEEPRRPAKVLLQRERPVFRKPPKA